MIYNNQLSVTYTHRMATHFEIFSLQFIQMNIFTFITSTYLGMKPA